ncbi:hypothetical protein [Mucilaginibacter myungsuensis]|uniref:GLPGLI family protein n=1 Tax=Mucilaginibacter myungsuensis TaxID=649104 RepID=A0A929L1Z6_9SPHI|nr:hypothetical protein [Mucilaginibacter myungsuensis]MBE9661771.1 hypothetical protein [Mucilaginibacter myungsuensis]MDN3599795.1 hypothetical protein [Mucilaginibacter myungsuensis]
MKSLQTIKLLLLCLAINGHVFAQNRAAPAVLSKYQTKSGRTFTLYNDHTFQIMRSTPKGHMEGTLCDTIAKGSWSVVNKSVLKLSETQESRKVKYKIDKDNKLSNDSVYFKIVLPESDTFFDQKFEFTFGFIGVDAPTNTRTTKFTISKKDVFKHSADNGYLATFSALDMSPMNAEYLGKCYQRVYFDIANDIKLDKNFNYYTITLTNFTGCFVERAAVDNDYVVLTADGLHWQDMDFKKVK